MKPVKVDRLAGKKGGRIKIENDGTYFQVGQVCS